MHEKIFNRKTIIIVSVIVTVIVLLLVFSNSLRDAVQEAVKPDESKLSQTYNASRYFFRVGYPDDWYVEEDANGFGFKNDNDKGIVIRMFNSADAGKNVAENQKPSATAGNSMQDQESVIEEDYSTVINFFYRDIKNGETLSNLDACKRYMDEFAAGLMYGDGFKALYNFGSISEFTADNLTFSCVAYTCSVYTCTTGANGEEILSQEPVKQYVGELYTASRSMAYYAINFETSLEKSSSEYTEYRKDFVNILNDFRFSVFED